MKFLLIILLVTVMNEALQSQQPVQPKTVLKYLVREPKIKTGKPPLLLLLHGVGSNEKDLFSLAGNLPDDYLVISVRAPNTLQEGCYAWFQVDFSSGKPNINPAQAEESRKIIIEFIGQLKDLYSFNGQQIYLCGFSQGGIMSYSVGLTRPDLVKGIAVMSGRLLNEVKPMIASKEELRPLRVFISHGTNDMTLGIDYAHSAKAYLQALGIEPAYKEYAAGHGINANMLKDLNNWLVIR